jgi:hypothetical protein
VAKFATIRQRSARRMSSGDDFSSPARTGSAVEIRVGHDPIETLGSASAVAFQQATESLLATNVGKRYDFVFDSGSFGPRPSPCFHFDQQFVV